MKREKCLFKIIITVKIIFNINANQIQIRTYERDCEILDKTLETLDQEPEVPGPELATSQLNDPERATCGLCATISSSVK